MATSRTAHVGAPHGLHARPATAVVRMANRFRSDISLLNETTSERANAKSIFDVMILCAYHGVGVVITAAGPDEAEAAEELARLIASDFHEETGSGVFILSDQAGEEAPGEGPGAPPPAGP